MRTGTITLETQRLILRRFTMDDAQQMFNNYCNDELVCRYVTWNTHGNIETTKEYLKSFIHRYSEPAFYHWAVVLKENGEVIGAIDAVKVDADLGFAEMGWVIGRYYQNRGIMTETAKTVFDYMFRQGFETLHAKFHAENTASGKVMSKIGMIFAGYEKNVAYKNENDKVDLIHFELRKKDYAPNTR